ncbi:MAG: DUF4238 domain-containing protein [Pyrinomonadaceae bacterium]
MSRKEENKRNHHTLPKLYLKGFVEKEGEPFIWVYERGKSYNPGLKRGKYNPYRDSINYAGAERDVYAYTNKDGVTDFNTYENVLEKLEKPADPVFQKIRNQQMITSDEKTIFASYMIMMIKRVPRRKERAKEIWPSTLDSFEESSELMQWLNAEEANTDPNDLEKLAKLSRLGAEVRRILEEYRENIPTEILLKTMVLESALLPVIGDMNWQFFIAPEGYSFFTSDNPVFYFESFGLNKLYSEITFPISSNIVLAASWHKELGEGFFPANSETVLEVNRRTASIASMNAYHSRKTSWLVDVLNKQRHRLNLLYSYSGELG